MSIEQVQSGPGVWQLMGLPIYGDMTPTEQVDGQGVTEIYENLGDVPKTPLAVEQRAMAEVSDQPVDGTETGYFEALPLSESTDIPSGPSDGKEGAQNDSVSKREDEADSLVLLDPEAATHQDLVWANEKLSGDMAQLLETVRSLGSVWGKELKSAQNRYTSLIDHQNTLAEQRVACKERIDGDGTDENPGTKKIAEDAHLAHVQAESELDKDTSAFKKPLNEIIDTTSSIRDTDPDIEGVNELTAQFDQLAITALKLATGYSVSPEWLDDLRQKATTEGSTIATLTQLAKARAVSDAEERKHREASRAADAQHQNELDTLEDIRQGEYKASYDVLAASKQVRKQQRIARKAIRVSNGGAVKIGLRKLGAYLGFVTAESEGDQTIDAKAEEESNQ